MKRLYLNMLAAVTILVGAWVMASPDPVVASMACCKADNGAQCCGNYCTAGPNGCVGCDNREDCQL